MDDVIKLTMLTAPKVFCKVAMKEIMLGSLNHNQPYLEITNSIFAPKTDF